MNDVDTLFQKKETVPQPVNQGGQIQPPYKKPGRSGKPSKKVLTIVLAVVAVAIIGVGGYLGYTKYNNLKKENAKLANPTEAAKAENDKLKDEVSKAIELPADENPTIATVVDASKLKSQAFFTNAENGDKVLIYSKAKKAVLYRPSTKKVIEVAPINIGANETKK